jgi:uncharacterized protein (TIRG00374 family)
MSRGVKRALRWAATLVVGALLINFARTVNWAQSWALIRSASPVLLLAAAVVNLASLALKGVRWWIFLRAVGVRSLGLAVRATTAGAGLNNVLVANGGDAARVVFVARKTGTTSARVLASLALERLFDAVGFVVLLAGFAALLPLPAALDRWRIPAWFALAGLLVFLGWLATRKPQETMLATAEADLPAGFVPKARHYLGRFAASVAEQSNVPRFAGALALSLGAWALQLLTFDLTARAAHLPLAVGGSAAALLAVNTGLLLRATPGNVGVFQAMYALAAVAFGMRRDDAIAVSLLIQAIQILPVTLLGIALAPEFVLNRKTALRAGDAAGLSK